MNDDDIKKEADARHDLHKEHPSHRPLSDDYESRGIKGEELGEIFFEMERDKTLRPGGDKGYDFLVWMKTKTGTRQVTVDIKYARKPTFLVIEAGVPHRSRVYVLAGPDPETGEDALLGWELRENLEKVDPVPFKGFDIPNHRILREDLRPMSELKKMLVEVK